MRLQQLFEKFLGSCARAALRREQPSIIAVAGSVGKSSTKEAIGIALGASEPKSRVAMTRKSYNNALGVPLTIFGQETPGRSPVAWLRILFIACCARFGLMKLRASTFVLEMGADHPGDLATLLSIAPPHVGVLTAISPEHMEFFGSIEAVQREEGTVIRLLGPDAIAVVNADDARAIACADEWSGNRLTFGNSEHAIARVLSACLIVDFASPGSSGLDVTISLFEWTRSFRLTGIIGRPHAYAVAAALAVVHVIHGDARLAAERLAAEYRGLPGRMRLLEGVKHTWLIDDSYNSSPAAALSAIRDLADFPLQAGSRRIAALGDMLEFGSFSDSAHRDLGRAAAEAAIDVLICCGTFAHAIRDGARAAGMPEDRLFVFAQSAEAGRFIQTILQKGDVVLIKGSQGVRMERIVLELLAHPERAEELVVRQTREWREKM